MTGLRGESRTDTATAPCPDAPVGDGFLLDLLPAEFCVLALNVNVDTELPVIGPEISPELRERYLGEATSALYLIRPDGHVAARWETATAKDIDAAHRRALGW